MRRAGEMDAVASGSQWKEQSVVVKVSSRHMEVSAALHDYAAQKAGRLGKYYDRIREVEVVLEPATGAGHTRVEMIVHADAARQFVAHADHLDAYAGVDACVDKLERQLHEYKDMHRNRKHLAGDVKHPRG
jgi:putative sigma-54 modulation protein